MRTLDDWNKMLTEHYIELNRYPKYNGIACPKCGRELQDVDSIILTSNPPKRKVFCENCTFVDYRIC